MTSYITMPNGLLARPNTSDEGTWHDVFDEDKAWHRPPLGLEINTTLDLGAYTGYTVFDLLSLFPTARVIAVEADPENFDLMVENLANYGVSCINAAVWDYNGYGRLRGDHYNAKQIELGANIPVCTIDNILQTHKIQKVDYIKFDIEGAEREVLRMKEQKWPYLTQCVKIETHEPYYVSECIQDLKLWGFEAIQDTRHPNAVVGFRV